MDVSEHPGWTGNLETSFQVNHISSNTPTINQRGSFKYRNKFSSSSLSNSYGITNNMPKEFHRLIQGPVPDGSSCILYWADSFKEVVFLIATNENISPPSNKVDFGLPIVDSAGRLYFISYFLITAKHPCDLIKSDFGLNCL